MYRILFIAGERPEDFVSSWGVLSSFTQYDNGWFCALGWESELEERGIPYEIIEIDGDGN